MDKPINELQISIQIVFHNNIKQINSQQDPTTMYALLSVEVLHKRHKGGGGV